MSFRIRHGSNNYGGAGGLAPGVAQYENTRHTRKAEELQSRSLDLQEQALAQRAQEFAANLSQEEKQMIVREKQTEDARSQQAQQFAAGMSQKEKEMFLDEAYRQKIFESQETGREHDIDMLEKRYGLMADLEENKLTSAQRREVERINYAFDDISRRQASGEIPQDVAEHLRAQLYAKANGIVPPPLSMTSEQPTPQQLWEQSVVTAEDGTRWAMDNNGRWQSLDEQSGKDAIKQQEIELDKEKAVQQQWLDIYTEVLSETEEGFDENGSPVKERKYTPEEAADLTDNIMSRFGFEGTKQMPPLIGSDAISGLKQIGQSVWKGMTENVPETGLEFDNNDPLGLGI